jgi:hypothetical protein
VQNPAAWGVKKGDLYSYFAQNPQGLPCSEGNNVPADPGSIGCNGFTVRNPVYIETYLSTFSNEFHMQVHYPRGTDGAFPTGITFLVNDGPRFSNGVSGRSAIFYVDASKNINAPILNVYAYNASFTGNGVLTSWQYGNAYSQSNGSDGRPADKIVTSLAPPANFLTGKWPTGYRLDRQVRVNDQTNTTGPLAGIETRVFTINIDASIILNHRPAYPSSLPWQGIGIGGRANNPNTDVPRLGLWLWAFNGLDTRYGNDGYLTSWLSSTNFSFRSFKLIDRPLNDWCPIDCRGEIWGVNTCPVNPSPTPALPQCTSRSFTDNLFALDGGAAGLKEVVKFATQRLTKLSARLPAKRRERNTNLSATALKLAEDQFTVAWAISWSFPQNLIQCEGALSSNCSVLDLRSQSANYIGATSKIFDIATQLSRELKRIRSSAARAAAASVTRLSKERFEEAEEFKNLIPSSTIQCS